MPPLLSDIRRAVSQTPPSRRRHAAPSPTIVAVTAPRKRSRATGASQDAVPDPIALREVDTSSPDSFPTLTTTPTIVHSSLLRRQTTYLPSIPTSYQDLYTGPAPGTIVGIVLGAVLGFCLLFWVLIAVLGNRANAQYVEGDDTEIVVRRDRHSSHRSRHTRTHRTHHTHRSRSSRSSSSSSRSRPNNPPPRKSPSRHRSERILVQETVRRTESSRPPPMPNPPSVSQASPRNERVTETIHIENRSNARRVEGDDMVEVIEENQDVDTTPKRKSKGGYRTVDPSQYGGGNFPQKEYNDRRSSRR